MRNVHLRLIATLVGLVLVVPAVAWESDEEARSYIRAHYTKFEHRVPMRDGVRLFTVVYIPNDASPSRTYPMLMTRSPYSVRAYGADRYSNQIGPAREFPREGYIFVLQDVRGRFMSEGEFVNMRPHRDAATDAAAIDESTDTYDTIEWLLAHVPHHNGKVGLWGNSYPGFYTSSGIIDSHPALAAAMPSAPIADWYFDDMHHHGAFALALTFNFFATFGQVRDGLVTEWPERFDHGTPDGYQFFLDLGPLSNANEHHLKGEIPFWNDIVAHPDYDSFWASRDILPHLKNISCAVMTVGGLFDAEDLHGSFNTYRAIEQNNPSIESSIVMGPWRHGAWLYADGQELGDQDFGFATAEDFRRRFLLPFFDHYLKGGPAPELPEALVFETGANRWRSFDAWPPKARQPRTAYLHQGGSLRWEPPVSEGEAFDEFPSDPANPVPFTATITTGWYAEYMTEDQRFASRRPDVLVYRSEPMEEDLTLAGPLEAELWVSTTGSAADWVVKLVDELPPRLPGYDPDSEDRDRGGSQLLIRSEVFRGRYRSSYSRPEPFVPGEVTRVVIPLQGVLHTFKRGHRIMIQVQSSLFPLFDRNPQTWVPNIFEAEEADFAKATHRVHVSPDHPSCVRISVLTSEE
jgi:putative CocE/NonD family hydrolase